MSGVTTLDAVVTPEALRTVDEIAPLAGAGPEAVVAPADDEECARAMSWASETGVGVLPVGNCGMLEPFDVERRWIALSTHRLTGITAYEAADLTLTARAGTPVAEVDAAMRANRQWAPFDPPGALDSTLGGLVSSGQSGPLWAGYGELRNHVLGATLVTGDGRILRLGGRVVKNVAGFDLLKLVVGGRGSFGVVTSVCLRAFPEPIEDRVLVLAASTFSELAGPALRIATAPIVPAASVVVDHLPTSRTPGLVVRLHGSRATVDADQRRLEGHLGVKLSPVDDPLPFVRAVTERTADDPIVVRLSSSPSRMGGLLGVVERIGAAGVSLDAYGARGRVSFDTTRARAATELLDVAPDLSATAVVERAPVGSALWSRGVQRPAVEAALLSGLSTAFDPEGVLWPTRA